MSSEAKVIKSLQHVAKDQILFLECQEEKIFVVSEANEVIKVSFDEKKVQKEPLKTQVKQDFYNSQFKADGMMLGVCNCSGKMVGLTDSYFYVW